MVKSTMELRHLRYFAAAAEAENVSRAAMRLHVSQPALSRQIRDLEEELGFALFERGAKSVRLTDAGTVFLKEARAVLQRAEAAVAAARAAAQNGQPDLHVGYAPSPTVRILPATLRLFQARLPKVRVRLHDMSTEEMLSGVRQAQLQLALVVRPKRAMLRGLKFEELAKEPMCLAVPPGHMLTRNRSVVLENIAQSPLVAFSRKEYPEYHEYLEKLFAGVGKKPRIAEEHDSSSSLITAIESGAGVAIVARSFSCSSGPRLKFISISPMPDPLIVGVAWIGSLSSVARGFYEAAKEAIGGMKEMQS